MKNVSFNDVLTIHYTDSHYECRQRFWEKKMSVSIDGGFIEEYNCLKKTQCV